MVDRFVFVKAGETLAEILGRDVVELRKELAERTDAGVEAVDDRVYLGPIARRQDHGLPHMLRGARCMQCLRQLGRFEREALQQLERRALVVETGDEYRH